MSPEKAVSIEDLRHAARRRLPRIIYDYIEGGAEDENAIERNPRRFRELLLTPRYLRDVSAPDASSELLGQRFLLPVGVAPTGMSDITRRGADLDLARAAYATGAPYILSGASNASIEAVAGAHPGAWYQIYLPRTGEILRDLLRRVADAGLPTLVVTVDVPAHSKRERNIRQGWVRPYNPTWMAKLEALTHPAWLISYLANGLPYLENWQSYAQPGASAMDVANLYAAEVPSVQTWDTIREIRELWSGKLVLKGILHPEDARLAIGVGVDGLIVSNHGGRQFDRGIATIDAFPAIRHACGDKITLMLDSGITRGADIVAAFCLGASMTFVGRATLYGAAAFGQAGATRALEILNKEVMLALAQVGCPAIRDLDESYLAVSGS